MGLKMGDKVKLIDIILLEGLYEEQDDAYMFETCDAPFEMLEELTDIYEVTHVDNDGDFKVKGYEWVIPHEMGEKYEG